MSNKGKNSKRLAIGPFLAPRSVQARGLPAAAAVATVRYADGRLVGDSNSPYPGDRPAAYSADMTDELFERKFTGSLDSLSAITFSDGTQCHGKLLEGFKPADGFKVDAKGMVVHKPK